eukprot:1145463-Pelagomonas_calceolata.AAC.4
MLTGEGQSQADQPNSLAEGSPFRSVNLQHNLPHAIPSNNFAMLYCAARALHSLRGGGDSRLF